MLLQWQRIRVLIFEDIFVWESYWGQTWSFLDDSNGQMVKWSSGTQVYLIENALVTLLEQTEGKVWERLKSDSVGCYIKINEWRDVGSKE